MASSYEIGKFPLQNQQHDNLSEEEVPTNIVACVEFDPECAECVKQRLEANTGTVPLSLVKEHANFLFNK